MVATNILIFLTTALSVVAKNAPDFQKFVTEPKFTAVTIDIRKNKRPDEQAPGSIFLAPYKAEHGFGPQIFDTSGNLIWFGGRGVKIRAIDLHPCLYNSTDYNHLCYNDAVPFEQGGHSSGLVRFFNNNYTQVGEDFGKFGDLRAPDIHELNTPPATQGKSFLVDIFQVRKRDLRPYKGPREGHILDGCFQEIDILSRKVIFQWCSLDHTDIDMTYVYLDGFGNYTIPGLAGSGARNAPWDYFHINSVDKSSDGDYLVSARHANSILHVAGPDNKNGYKPGEVIWYLGGKLNSFEFEKGLNFSAQHTIRYFREKTEKGMDVSFLNNAYEGRSKTAKMSSGMAISLDTQEMRASLIARYIQPSGFFAQDQGSLQMLPNGNALMGWGRCNYFSEHDPKGEVLYYAQFGGKGDCDRVPKEKTFFVSSFRAWKFPWKGYPITRSKVVSFSKSCDQQATVYVSWNGATEVSSWEIYASNSTKPEEEPHTFKEVATVPKAGFETTINVPLSRYVYVLPLDKEQQPLRSSKTAKTFVPKEEVECNNARCMSKDRISVQNDSMADSCFHKPHFLFDESGMMNFQVGNFRVGGAVLVGIFLPFAVIFALVIWLRNRRPKLPDALPKSIKRRA